MRDRPGTGRARVEPGKYQEEDLRYRLLMLMVPTRPSRVQEDSDEGWNGFPKEVSA